NILPVQVYLESHRYKLNLPLYNFHNSARKHSLTMWHKQAYADATNFINVRSHPEQSIVCQVNSAVKHQVEENRKKLYSVLSTIVFCGTHDIALRGKTSTSGNVQALYDFRIESGDEILKNHLKNAPVNALLCEDILRERIISAANNSVGFSVIADESADISGHEQLSLGVRFVDLTITPVKIREEFLGFATLKAFDATSIANVIMEQCIKFGLNIDKLYGQGYDGCSTMAGKEGGVQAKIKEKYPRAIFVHCASHKLNLVVNNLNAVPEIRNAIGSVKAIIKFFRESPKRRSLIPNVPLLCETRWTAKYKSIRVFSENFDRIFQQLRDLVSTASGKISQEAHQLLCCSSTSTFLFCLVIMATYSARLEPLTQALQAVEMDIAKAHSHVQELIQMFLNHRQQAEEHFKDILVNVQNIAERTDIELSLPRRCGRQKHHSNVPGSTVEEYYRRAIYVPYLDSVIASLKTRFDCHNITNFNLFSLHPHQMAKIKQQEFKEKIKQITSIYNIDNLDAEALTWFDLWSGKEKQDFQNGLLDLLPYTDLIPAVRQAILIALTLPVTTCTVERSFSSMRRVKTWLRSTMTVNRLSGLCMMSLHRDIVNENRPQFIHEVVDKFAQDHRRLQFLFRAN
uniref:HAT C-terminal dimerisation domain-containing protein n=1 Tax=Xenopus tropicalis TaxID=8364 RepID=A0A6I8QP26_XENTR